uniref:SGNH hydrolase-type esterase domain-containing protein n=1 Tax=viral metagenome TaxID=1070528 RepID=A0A6C0AS65_9ZZZZ
MSYFYLYIFILAIFIIGVSYWNTYREGFNSEKQTFVLLGDSIFKNDQYVSDGKSVNQLLSERTNGKTICLAKNDAKIANVYDQVKQIEPYLNSTTTTIFLSVGGNDILSRAQNNANGDNNFLSTVFEEYKSLVNSIQTQLPKANIVLCDIYYPDNLKYKQYHPIISEWNDMIQTFARDPKNRIMGVFKISYILTTPEDFTLEIEPSDIGGQKIVDTMLSSY